MRSGTTLSDRPTVLLVDDNEAMLARATAVLKAYFMIVGVARDGRAAIEADATLHPEVIVLDISMPGMTGLETASQLHKSGSKAALVFLTVHDEEDFVLAAKAAGGIGYVVKSRLASDLIPAVREAVEGRSFVSPLH
jgi:DNA-binding NarL/FixJ family response regulator